MTAIARLVLATCAAVALVVPAGAVGAETPTNVRWSTPVTVVALQGTPNTGFFIIDPFEASVPHVGRATIQMFFVTCLPCDTASLTLRITAPGGTLVLNGSSNSDNETMNSGTWFVTEGTGRFARYTGSGTWTWAWAPSQSRTGTLALVGHLGKT
jgi:hypothetical protein